jgi:hypothetical protein
MQANEIFELKVEILRLMKELDPTGNWENKGALALNEPRSKTGEPKLTKLIEISEDLKENRLNSKYFIGLFSKVRNAP